MSIRDAIGPATTSAKEVMRRKLRDALGLNTQQPASNENLNAACLPAIDDVYQAFVANFRAQGGKCKVCGKEQIMPFMVQFLKSQKYGQIFCNSPFLESYLKAGNVPVQSSLNLDFPPEIVVVYADLMIARSGSFVFSQKFSIYPSVKNVASDILVIGASTRIVPDVNNALELLADEDKKSNTGLVEIVTPAHPEIIDGKEKYSKINPRIILLLAND